ncbi:MAG: type II secretion system protein [Chthoniobacterales bacterium]|nr:type II secretion system protein [Chthoniobacterales bacterium]
MIVVSIIALLAAIAVPGLVRARERAKKTRFVNALRVARDAFELYATEHNTYPPDDGPGVLPPGMQTYFGSKLNWTAPSPIGGQWDWDNNYLGITGVSVWMTALPREEMEEVDRMIDDGNLSAGAFRESQLNRYTWLVE